MRSNDPARADRFATFIIDAFTDRAFGGNPAAVCLLEHELSDSRMLAIAAEFGFSETAFVMLGRERHGLRWFTPTAEVALCGHATLAASAALWDLGIAPADTHISLATLSGELVARSSAAGISIDLPRMELIPTRLADDTARALGVEPIDCFRTPNRGGIEDWDYLVPLASEAAVIAIAPDMAALAKTTAGVIVTAPSTDASEFDFVSRYFAPYWGIPEDPATGSAHCTLAPYWSGTLGKQRMRARQLSKRGGVLDVALGETTVTLTGRVAIVLRGELTI
jgi:PhzF family phenazine biosynthesis protein